MCVLSLGSLSLGLLLHGVGQLLLCFGRELAKAQAHAPGKVDKLFCATRYALWGRGVQIGGAPKQDAPPPHPFPGPCA